MASSSAQIDVSTLPSSPTSPSWESPRHFTFDLGSAIVTGPIQPLTPTGKALKQLSIELEILVEDNLSLATVQNFLDRYKIPYGSGTEEASAIHPLVLEWLSHREILKIVLEKNREDIARYLIDQGFSVNGDGIHEMCKKSPELVKQVIEQGKWDINQPISETLPPILASFPTNPEMIQYLLVHGANPNLASSNGNYTIFHSLSQYATIAVLTLVLSASPASILPGSPSADVVFHAATAHTHRKDRIDIIKFLLDNGAPIDMVAGCGKYENQAKYLVQLWAMGRKTALHWAVEHGMVDLVEFLVQRGADVGKETWSLRTGSRWVSVEELAVMCDYEDIREVLVRGKGEV
ncbi:ankyrin [Periconia macrospinosa]|uniref:Ankyrin n=1 Tax=Periconia macrospinosa TaxID=97972 RepID=A0A2V1DEB5_9PLEO|nr:ankyrin [Periconia macrospinosa]